MRMLFDGKACINGCTFCCSAICQGGFLNCHTIFMSTSLSLLSLHTVTPLMKGQAWNVWRGTQSTRWQFCSLFFVEHSLYLLYKVPRSLSEFFFPLFAWSLTVQVTVCWGMVWTLHHFCSVYSHFSQRWIPVGLAIRMQDCL